MVWIYFIFSIHPLEVHLVCFQWFGSYEQSCPKHSYAGFSVDISF